MLKKLTSMIIAVMMVMTGVGTGFADHIVTGDGPEAAAASYPALKKINYKPTGNQRDDIIGYARTQIGYVEGRNNNTYFGNWYGANYNPWCAMFVYWCARKADVPKSVVPASATADRSWAKKQGVYKKSKYWGGNYTPKKGDLIYFSWSVRDWADHIGLVAGTGKSAGTTYVYTIEGNKHDKVTEGSYPINNRYILGYASPKYGTGEAKETSTEKKEATYTVKFRNSLTTEDSDEDDALFPPMKGTYGKDLTLPKDKFERPGYTYTKWKIFRQNKNGKNIYLCRDTATNTKEEWYTKSKVPEDYSRVYVKSGEALRVNTKIDGETVYATPVWKERSYEITYDANGGTDAPQVQQKKHGESVTISGDEPVRNEYSFRGWASESKAAEPQYKGGDEYDEDQDVTLYAVWQAEKYKAKTTAKANARSGPGKKYDVQYAIKSGTEIKIVKISGAWGQLEDGNWVALKFTQRLGVTEYQLNYQDGLDSTTTDSAVIPPVMVSYGEPLTASVSTFKRTGYHYDNWKLYYMLNGEKAYLCKSKDTGKMKWILEDEIKGSGYALLELAPDEEFTIKKSVGEQICITPVWVKDVYEITYKANGGKNAPKAQSVEYGKSLNLQKTKPTRKGYVFLGWATEPNAVKAAYAAGDKYEPKQSVTFYAVWKTEGDQYVTTDEVNKRKGPGTDYKILSVIPKGKTVTIVKTQDKWGKLKEGGWIHLSLAKKVKTSQTAAVYDPSKEEDIDGDITGEGIGEGDSKETEKDNEKDSKETKPFSVRVIAKDGLNGRYGPDQKYDVGDAFEFGETMKISQVKDGWGRIAGDEEEQWVQLQYVRITDGYQVDVTSKDVQQKSGPGEEYADRGAIKPGTYAIVRISGDWGKVSYTGYWIQLDKVKRVGDEDNDEDGGKDSAKGSSKDSDKAGSEEE